MQVTFSHVSSTWRQIALDTRELWTDVSIDNPFNLNEQVYKTLLSRAGHRPIRLELDLDHDGVTECETADTFWKVVKRVHFKNLKLKISFGQISQLVESPGRTLHGLKQLDLVITNQNGPDSAPATPQFFSPAAMPQFVSRTHSLSFDDPPQAAYWLFPLIEGLAFPWAQLSCLQLIRANIALSECIDLLLRAPFLEECYLHINQADAEEEELLKLPLIRKFTLDLGEGSVAVDEVIRHLEFPNLEQLKLVGIAAWSDKKYDLIKRQCNLCHLQGLHFLRYRGDPYATDIRTVLENAPMLRCLDVPWFTILDEEAHRGISSGDLGHSLKNLTIPCIDSEVEEILNMVEERQKTLARNIERSYSWREPELASLKEVTIKVFWNHVQGNTIEKLRERYEERIVELERLGVRTELLEFRTSVPT